MCAVPQSLTRKFTICVHEVKYMLKMKHKEKHFRAVHKSRISAPDVILKCKSCSPQHWHSQSQLFGTKKDARSAKCVHLQHRTMTNAVHRGNKAVHTPTNAVHKNVAQTCVVRNACTCSTEH